MELTSFKQLLLIFTALIALSSEARADKYAVIIGGSSKNAESSQQEFARVTAASTMGLLDQGYQVNSLFGSGGDSPEKQKYSRDYEKIASLQSKKNSATESSIDDTFENLITKAKPGDRVEILIAAHGADTCGELGQLSRNDLNSGCEHTFTVFDKDGKEVQYPSRKILEYVKRLEDKGALPSLILDSCHSGRAKDAFQKLGLKNTCAFFQSAGNELGYGCFEDDPDFSKDYTSSGEYLAMRYYKGSLAEFAKDPYFSQSKCFQKTSKYLSDKKIDLSSISSAYWTSRAADQTFQSPAISSQMDITYFTKGLLQPQIAKQQNLSCEQLNMATASLVKQLSSIGVQISDVATAPYYQSLSEYNQVVSDLKRMIEKGYDTSEQMTAIAKLQAKVREKAENFVKQERLLIDGLFKNKTAAPNDPCLRSL